MVSISDIKTIKPDNYFSKLERNVFLLLEKLTIYYEYVTNDVVEKMDECVEIDKSLGCEVRKSILLTNKKRTSFFLVVLPANKNLDVKLLEAKIGVSGLTFAKSEEMEDILGVLPGSLTVLSVISDLDDYVQVVIDKEVMDDEFFACNTGVNQRHLKMKTVDLSLYLKCVHHRVRVVEL